VDQTAQNDLRESSELGFANFSGRVENDILGKGALKACLQPVN
jgi:hypothetical protein